MKTRWRSCAGATIRSRTRACPTPTELMKADLVTEIVRILRERELGGARAAELAGTTEADISRIRRASLDRFTIDRLVKILNRLDREIAVAVTMRPRGEGDERPGVANP